MLRLRLCLCALCFWPWLAMAGIGIDGARLLLSRCGFGAPPDLIAEFAPLTREQAVDRLLAQSSDTLTVAPPDWTSQPLSRLDQRNASEAQKKALRDLHNQQGQALKAWWLAEMHDSPDGLNEKNDPVLA